jgi:hypothetical protein
VLANRPLAYWRLDESQGFTAADAIPTLQYGVAGPTNPDTAVAFGGGTGYVATTTSYSDPSQYSIELWFKTSTPEGKLIGFENEQTGASNSYDRQIYMTNSGQLVFGQYTGSVVTVTSSASYNDGKWHQAVGTYDGSNLVLYVDGAEVASASAGNPQNFAGYWRIGGGALQGWPSLPSSAYFQGAIGEVAIWNSTVLSAAQAANHYGAAGGGAYGSTVLADSPTAYWKLNEASGPNLADATGNGNTGLAQMINSNGLYSGGFTLGEPGVITSDSAVLLDGSTGQVNLPLLTTAVANVTLECWVNISGATKGSLIKIGNGSTGYGIGVGGTTEDNSGTNLVGLYEMVRWLNPSITPVLSLNVWHHVALVVDGSGNPTLYLDGVAFALPSGGGPDAPSGSACIGCDNSGRQFGGLIDEAAVYNYALTAAQLAAHYHAAGH